MYCIIIKTPLRNKVLDDNLWSRHRFEDSMNNINKVQNVCEQRSLGPVEY